MTTRNRITLAAIVAIQVVLLAVVAVRHAGQITPDGVAYLRIASYLVDGPSTLAFTGYRGPLLSVLMTPMLAFGSDPLVAARVAMALSALVFVLGGFAVLRALGLPAFAVTLGTGLLALMSVRFSVFGITPDLLMAGLVGLGASVLVAPTWGRDRWRPIVAGVLFGLAFLAKAAALPAFVGVTVVVVGLRVWTRSGDRGGLGGVGMGAAWTAAGFAAVAGPWVLALSLELGTPVVSSSARVAHAVVGPDPAARRSPGATMFVAPPPGRVTTWEDPSVLPYATWSPFASAANLRHQVRLIAANAALIWRYLSGLDVLRVGVLSLVIALLVHAPWRENLAAERWRWSGALALAVCAGYLPVFAAAPRFYFAAIPFVLAASLGLVLRLTEGDGTRRTLARVVGVCSVGLSFGVPHAMKVETVLTEGGGAPATQLLARRLAPLGVVGPVAGDGDDGLAVAYFLGQPYLGGVRGAGPADFDRAGARLVVVRRGSAVAAALDASPVFADLASRLYPDGPPPSRVPLQAFMRREIGARAEAVAEDGIPPSGP